MNENQISQYITETFESVDTATVSDNSFFTYNPERSTPPDYRFMFATLMTNDINDQVSNLDRPSIFRLNIGVSKQTFRSLFGDSVQLSEGESEEAKDQSVSGYDFTVLNKMMPHPIYGRMSWVCVLNPDEHLLETTVQPLLAEAYEIAVSKYKRLAARKQASSGQASK